MRIRFLQEIRSFRALLQALHFSANHYNCDLRYYLLVLLDAHIATGLQPNRTEFATALSLFYAPAFKLPTIAFILI